MNHPVVGHPGVGHPGVGRGARFFAMLVLAGAAALPAQGGDPMREIQEIARQVDEQLQEIDRLLLESGRRDQQRQRPKELLQQARERSVDVEKGIDKLIEELTKLKQQQQQQSSSSSQDQQDQQQQSQDEQRQRQGQRNRRENQTSEFTQRQRNQSGEQQQQQQGQQQGEQPMPEGQQPNGGQETPDGGENRRGNQPPESELGPGQPGTGEDGWGELQPYVNFLKNRGSMPKVPEKYRKYWEAYLKQKQASPRK